MEFRIQQHVLMAMLTKASKVVPSRDIVPVLKNYSIEAVDGSVGYLRVSATDLELSLLVVGFADVATPGRALLPSRKLLEIVASAEDEEVFVRVDEGRCHIDIGRASWTLAVDNRPNVYPQLPELVGMDLTPVPRVEFLDALQMVYKAAGSATSRPNLMLLDIHDGKITATDGVRCQQVTMESWPTTLDMQIPVGAAPELIRLLRSTEVEQIRVAEVEDYLAFEIDSDLFLANAIAMEYPPVDSQMVLPALTNTHEMTCDRGALTDALRRVRITADADTSAVILEMAQNILTLRSSDKMANEAAESVDCSWELAARTVVVNHRFLMDMLDMTTTETCAFFFGPDTTSKRSPLLLKDVDAGLVGIVSQMRVDWA